MSGAPFFGASAPPPREVGGVSVPALLYGTAWKEERTAGLVGAALAAGFRGVDTANQRRHYHEAAVGSALGEAIARGAVARDELFVQTKFTYVEGQDARLPYDPNAPLREQVRQSFLSSRSHLGVERLDSYLLHGPRTRRGLSQGDREVWRAMEELHAGGAVALLGVSNVTAEQLLSLCAFAAVRPAFVQNRCFARLGWDRDVREVCRDEGVVYQGFSLLTANGPELASPALGRIAARHGASRAQVVFRLALELGMVVLTGTTDPAHMREDLAIGGFALEPAEVAELERLSG